MNQDDLGFQFFVRKGGSVEILHHGISAATLRGMQAAAFVARVQGLTSSQAQQHMARITGNYKRGNEAHASRHIRNARQS